MNPETIERGLSALDSVTTKLPPTSMMSLVNKTASTGRLAPPITSGSVITARLEKLIVER